MKKNVLALSIATGLIDMFPEAHPVLMPYGEAVRFGDTGCGRMLLVPYYGGFQPWWLNASGKRNEDQYDFREFLK